MKKLSPARLVRHRAAARVLAARRYEQRRAAGLCTKCGERAPSAGRIDCDDCREFRRQKEAARADRLREERRCKVCSAPAVKLRCAACTAAERDYRRAMRADRRDRGLCIACGSPHTSGKSSCRACLDKEAARSKARRVAEILAEAAE